MPEPVERAGDAARARRASPRRRASAAPSRGAVVVAAPGREARRRRRRAPRAGGARIARDVVVGRGLAGDARARPSRTCAARRAAPAARSRSRAASRRARPCTRRRSPSPTGCPRRAPSRGCPRRPPSARSALAIAPRPHRREADAAVAHHARRHAVQRRRRELVVPRHLAVVVRVDVDEARRARCAPSASIVRRAAPSSCRRPRRCDRPATATSPVNAGAAGAVDDGAAR